MCDDIFTLPAFACVTCCWAGSPNAGRAPTDLWRDVIALEGMFCTHTSKRKTLFVNLYPCYLGFSYNGIVLKLLLI